WVGQRDKRRWPQWLSGLGLFLSALVGMNLVSLPSGAVGSAIGELLRQLFSTAGTFIVVVAIALAAFIGLTEKAALKVGALMWRWLRAARGQLWTWLLGAGTRIQQLFAARRTLAAQARLEDAAFLAQLEADDEVGRAEREAQEADAVAEEVFRLHKEREIER